jgi:hypothetical protein
MFLFRLCLWEAGTAAEIPLAAPVWALPMWIFTPRQSPEWMLNRSEGAPLAAFQRKSHLQFVDEIA